MTGTFSIDTTNAGKRDCPFVDSFEVDGETFVVHRSLLDDKLFRVSHKGTGWGIPQTTHADQSQSKALGMAMVERNRDKMKALIAEASR